MRNTFAILIISGLILSIFLIFLISAVSAEILLSQPASVYNYGDKLNVKATIKAWQDASDFFTLDLICNSSANFYKVPLTVKANEEKVVETSFVLEKDFVSPSLCDISARYNGEEETSQGFSISDKIDVNINIADVNIEAGKIINARGTALREDGKKAEGFLDLSSGDALKVSGEVKNGNFSVDFSFPENQKSGNYELKARVYEKYKDKETNSGTAASVIYIKQTPKKIEILIVNTSINPGEAVNYQTRVSDQAGDSMAASLDLKLVDSNEEVFVEKIISSESEESLVLDTSSSPGAWTIEASYLNLTSTKQFFVAEMEKADFQIENDTLTIINIGNVVYRKNIEITIGDYKEVKAVELAVGEKMKLLLKGNGSYDIKVSDGSNIKTGSISLTGGVVGIEEIKSSTSIFMKYPIVWIFFILVAGLVIMSLLRRTMKKTSYSYPAETPAEIKSAKISENTDRGVIIKVGSKTNLGEAEHVPVLDGRKEQASIVAVKIKNLDSVRKSEQLGRIEEIIQDNKGSVYATPGFIIGIFASPTTRTFNNEIIAVRAGKEIAATLASYNSLAKIKIEHGIGIHSGELIVKKGDKLEFTAIGNTLALAKKIADVSINEALLSRAVNNKLMSEIKAEKVSVSGIDAYKVKAITDRSRHEDFIAGFLERQKQ